MSISYLAIKNPGTVKNLIRKASISRGFVENLKGDLMVRILAGIGVDKVARAELVIGGSPDEGPGGIGQIGGGLDLIGTAGRAGGRRPARSRTRSGRSSQPVGQGLARALWHLGDEDRPCVSQGGLRGSGRPVPPASSPGAEVSAPVREPARPGHGLHGPGAEARAGGLPSVETANGVREATRPPECVKSGAGAPDVSLADRGTSLDRVLGRAESTAS